ASADLAATYAALILADEGIEITNVKDLLSNVGSGGGAPASGGAAAPSAGGGAAAEAPKEEEKEEEKEESDDDMGFGLFD
ncbi:60S acidic ribosomal protein P1, partial [Mycena leptocephala]